MSGTLDGKFSRKGTGTANWAEAHGIADAYEKARSWTGRPTPLSIIPEPAPSIVRRRITIDEAL